MRRVLGRVLAALIAWLCLIAPLDPAGAMSTAAPQGYAYDGHHHTSTATATTSERGPPASQGPHTFYDAVDRWSHGASARSGLGTSPTACAYDDPALLVQVARTATTARGAAGFANAGLVAFSRAGVAANAAETGIGAQGPLALTRAGPKLTQQGLEHIVERHWATSGAANAGKFAEGTTGRSLKSMIQDAVYNGSFRPNTMGRPGTIYEYDFGTKIGSDIGGSDTSWLRVVLGEDDTVITAFPFSP